MQNLPIGQSSFERIRQNNDLYVDKTRYIHKMVSEGSYYFLSRPRRFGKSLTVSTLRCLFEGKKDLFEGLWIAENTDWQWREYAVLSLDFNQISQDTPEHLKMSLSRALKRIADAHDLVSDAPLLKEQFLELILAIHQKTGRSVVILIDEYDKPIIDHLGKGTAHLEIAKENRDILKAFFGVIKGGAVASVLRFVLLTGVSKFSRVSIFSELNNLKDLSMNRHFAAFLGYTQEELESCFSEHIQRFAKENEQPPAEIIESLRRYYNGYRFTEKDIRVYNPFSVLKSLDEMVFKNYWFETGTPTFLVNLLKEKDYPLAKIENLELDEQVFSVYEIERLQPEALLFQTGYITIQSIDESGLYRFEYPNQEVKISFLKYLMFAYVPADSHETSRFRWLSVYLQKQDLDGFFETITALFAGIPYSLESKRDESYFHTLFYLMVCASGVNARSEVLTCEGRIDLVMEFSDKLYIIEFKCNQNAQAAIDQIREKGYADPYQASGKKVILMGINFDTQKRNISEWLVD